MATYEYDTKGPILEVPVPVKSESSKNEKNSLSQAEDSTAPLEWTAEEEKRLVRKADTIVMPLLIAGLFLLQLDRGNIGNALTDFFFKDVGITQNQFNLGQQLLFAGIVIFEIPSNMVLYRIGPAAWLGGQFLAWGLVATFQAFQNGLASFLTTRFLLGACEAGFVPGALYTVTRWYTRKETAVRFSWFFMGNMISGGLSGFVAFGVLQMRGIRGLTGWQWLFILEGLFTVVGAALFIAFFPRSPENPRSLLGYSLFTEREIHILSTRVIRDDATKVNKGMNITKEEIKRTFTNWRLLLHMVFSICTFSSSVVFMNYGPTLVGSFGYGRLESNAMLSSLSFGVIPLSIFWGWAADRWGRRGPMVLIAIFIYSAFMIGNRAAISSPDGKKRFAILAMSSLFSFLWHPVNGAWLALNAQSPGERSLTMAIFIMTGNCAAMIGSQLFQQQDAPLYRVGWTAIMAIVCVGTSAAVGANIQYWLLNRRDIKRGLPPKYYP